jgi:tetratricopeptide (TPR) repeat protein
MPLALEGQAGEAGAKSRRAEAYARFLRGRIYEQEGRYPRALEAYREALALDPKSSHLHFKLGEMLFYAGQLREAKIHVEESLRIGESYEAHRLMARLHHSTARQKGRRGTAFYELAAQEYRRAMALAADSDLPGKSEDAAMELTKLYLALGQTEKAEEVLGVLLAQKPGNALPLLLLAEIRESQGLFNEVEDFLRRALEADPDSLQAIRTVASFYSARGRCAEAIPHLERLLDAIPPDFVTREQLGLCYIAEKRYENAIFLLEPFVSLQSTYDIVHLLALALRKTEQYDKAARLWLRFLQEQPGHLMARAELAGVYMLQEDYASSLEQYRILEDMLLRTRKTARVPHDELAKVLHRQGLVLVAMGQYGEAATAFERAMRLASAPSEDFYLAALEAWLNADEITRALTITIEALSHFPESTLLRFAMAEIFLRDGKETEAVESIEGILEEDDLTEGDYRQAAAFYRALEHPAEAMGVLKRGEKAFPKSDRIQFQLGALYERQRRFEEAERHLRHAIELNPRNAAALNYLGYILADRGGPLDEALALTKQAVAIDSGNGAYLDSLGWAHFRRGEYEESEKYLEQAIERLEDPIVRDHLGDVRFALGRIEDAIKEWRKALNGGVENAEEVREKIERAEAQLGAAQ